MAVCQTLLMYAVMNAAGMAFVEAGATDCTKCDKLLAKR